MEFKTKPKIVKLKVFLVCVSIYKMESGRGREGDEKGSSKQVKIVAAEFLIVIQ